MQLSLIDVEQHSDNCTDSARAFGTEIARACMHNICDMSKFDHSRCRMQCSSRRFSILVPEGSSIHFTISSQMKRTGSACAQLAVTRFHVLCWPSASRCY